MSDLHATHLITTNTDVHTVLRPILSDNVELLLPVRLQHVLNDIELRKCWGSRFWHNDDVPTSKANDLLTGSFSELRRRFDHYLWHHTSAHHEGTEAVLVEANVYDFILFLQNACGVGHIACEDALNAVTAIAEGTLQMPAAFTPRTLIAMRLLDAGLQKMYDCEHPEIRPLIEPLLPLFTGEIDIPAPNTKLPNIGTGLALLAIVRAQLHQTSPMVRQAMSVLLKHPNGGIADDITAVLRMHGVASESMLAAKNALHHHLHHQQFNEASNDVVSLLEQICAIRHTQQNLPLFTRDQVCALLLRHLPAA